MNKNPKTNFISRLISYANRAWSFCWRRGLWNRSITILAIITALVFGSMYAIAEWYIHSMSHRPIELGATFIPDYASQLGVNPSQTLKAILEPASHGGLGIKNVRLVSYWNDIEPVPGKYDFSKLDWQFALANKYGAKVSLAIGIRQPRWPECHQPSWVDGETKAAWEPQLYAFIKATVDRYKSNPALESYQLENEFFMKIFGSCSDYDRSRLITEAQLVKAADPAHRLIISRSDNWIGLPVRQPTPDQFGISVYKRVYDYHFTKRYVDYPLPPWYYAFLAGATKIVTHKDTMIHELQLEPWLPSGSINQSNLAEQAKSFNPSRMRDRINYAEDTGMKEIEMWGAEYWYWQKVNLDNPAYWQIAQQAVAKADAHNAQLK